jgi:ankyrin repeat protein
VLVKTLLKSERLDPNIAGPRGLTALHFVAQSNNPDLVRALLDDNRVDATLVSENGHTAQQMAVAEGHREVVDIFNAQLSAANPNT